MLQPKADGGLGDPLGFVAFHSERLASLDGTESARPRADAAENHEGRGLAFPTFGSVRTLGFFTDRVESEIGIVDARLETQLRTLQKILLTK